jgi:hypothetical protein
VAPAANLPCNVDRSLGGYCTDCPQPAAPSFALPFAMVRSPYCITAQMGGICTDNTCSLRHGPGIMRCEPCNCSFPSGSLQQHESGRQHLQNVASSGSRPSAPSQTAPTIQPALPANISPPAGGNTSTRGRPTNELGRQQNGFARALRSRPVNRRGVQSSVSTDDEEEGEELLDSGISVSDEEGLDVGIVERRRPNGPFATATALLTIKLAAGFPAVTFLEERIRTSDGSDPGCV